MGGMHSDSCSLVQKEKAQLGDGQQVEHTLDCDF